MTRKELETMTYEQRREYIKKLQNEILAMLGAPVEPEETETPAAKPKGKRGRRRIQRFDDLSDDEQIDNLRRLWGGEES